MKITFIMRRGGVVTWEVPESEREAFNYLALINNVRRDGFFQSADLHIRYSETSAILFTASETQAAPHVGWRN